MLINQYQAQVNRLNETYGNKAYGEERARLLWDKVSHLEEWQFRKTIDHIISECIHAPMVSKVFEISKQFTSSKDSRDVALEKARRESMKWCNACGKDGHISAKLKNDGGSFNFLCLCPHGDAEAINCPFLKRYTKDLQNQGWEYAWPYPKRQVKEVSLEDKQKIMKRMRSTSFFKKIQIPT